MKWAKSYYTDVNEMIESMLKRDIPVVASHYEKEIIDDYIFDRKIGIDYYSFNKETCNMNYAGCMYSHYFTITGIVEIYENNMYVKYARISSWGDEYYINLDEYAEELNYFTNFLYVNY